MSDDQRARERSYRWVWWVVAAVAVVGFIVWASTRPPEVTVATVERGDLSVTVTATGEVEGRVAEVSPIVQGQVEAVYREEGDRVSRGDLLCRIIAPGVPGTPAAAAATHQTVEAPFDGVVSRRYVDPGDAAVPGQPVYQVADTASVWVTALIDDIDVGKIHQGQAVEIVLPAYLGRSLPGRIAHINATATPRTQSGIGGKVVRSRIELTEGPGPLRPGMEVDMNAEAVMARDVVLAPADAVLEDETGRWVFLVVNGRVQRREVSLGANNYVKAEVTEGLQPGDVVVVGGKEDIADGDAVRTVERDDRG
ncbi:MAG: efflux RND transporter periplasmic adaptor subunit [Armatimonadota bacterium]|nr:efflux RND transporter periplasmic adaptor subunit [Armatimonadota bacterium]